jgi:hypothetical protein
VKVLIGYQNTGKGESSCWNLKHVAKSQRWEGRAGSPEVLGKQAVSRDCFVTWPVRKVYMYNEREAEMGQSPSSSQNKQLVNRSGMESWE